jgi:hypothetical protein
MLHNYIFVYGIEVGQTWRRAGQSATVEIVGLDTRRDEAIGQRPDGTQQRIPGWKLVTAKYSRVV